jgi:hypothetical protein
MAYTYKCDKCGEYVVSVGYIGWRGCTVIHRIGIFDNEKEAQEYVSIKRKQEHNNDWFENDGNPTIFIIEGNGKREFNSKVMD